MTTPATSWFSTVTAGSPPAATHPTRGKQVYTQACAGCHGPEGDRIAGKDLKSIKTRMNAQKIAAFILNPVLPMPRIFPEPRTAEDERDLHDVVAYVASWP